MKRLLFAALLVCGALSACNNPSASVPTASPVVQPTIAMPATLMPTMVTPATVVPATAVPPTAVQATAIPPTAVPPTAVPPTAVPPTAVPPTAVPPTAVPATPAPPQATSAVDAVSRFLAAAMLDNSGKQAVVYTDATLRARIQSGEQISSIIGQQNPYTNFVIDGVVTSAPPDATVKATLSYGSDSVPMAPRLFTVQESGGAWRVTSIAMPAPDEMQPDERAARDAAAMFIGELAKGNYANAAAFYGGDYQMLRDYNPDITGDPVSNPSAQDQLAIQAQLLERACTVNGFLCLPQRRIVGATKVDDSTFIVEMELNNRDGSQYSNPANNGAPFALRVQRFGTQFAVLDIPYAS